MTEPREHDDPGADQGDRWFDSVPATSVSCSIIAPECRCCSMKTLPELSVDLRVSLDRLRRLLRANPELAALATVHGPTRVFGPEAAERIRAALDGSNTGALAATS